MNVLGIGGYSHDSSAALVCDGRLVAAAEEERFTRRKHQEGWPREAIAFCLDRAGLGPEDVDHIGFYWRPWSVDAMKDVGRRLRHLPAYPVNSTGFLLDEAHKTAWYLYHLRREKARGGGRARIHFPQHHDTHAASAFFCSPFDEAAVLTIDSRGEWATTVMYHGAGNRLRPLRRIDLPHSVGVVYLCTTNALGFRTGDEYKVMGLAAYGQARYLDRFRQIVRLVPDGTYQVDPSYFTVDHSPGRFAGYVTERFTALFGPPRAPGSEITQHHMDVAASLQAVLEEAVFHMLNHLHRRTGSRNLCLAGGVVQNSVMCGKVHSKTPFDRVFIQPASGDNGCSLGSAYWVYNQALGQPRGEPFTTCALGPEFGEAQVRSVLDAAKLPYRKPDDLVGETARLIARGQIVGWFQGRMEWGARALGNRSILADVTDPEMTNVVNRHVKHREDFRPFAPACLAEQAGEYFDSDGPSPFMLKVFPARAKAKSQMPAIVHVDGTARLQTVTREENPLYYDLIAEVGRLKGVPCVLNTSFNVKGEPIVCTPTDALKCWASTGLDSLVIGPYVLEKAARC